MAPLWRGATPLVLAAILAMCVAGCSGGGGSDDDDDDGGGSGNSSPTAADDIVRADGAALNSINVLENDSDPDGEALTVAIEEEPPFGTATVNSDGTIQLSSLPSGFKGLVRFTYRASDPRGGSDEATAAIFVGADPFRVIFAGQAEGADSTEIYMTDFASGPEALTEATDGGFRLRGFAVSDNGATVAYRREETSAPANTELAFVRTDNGSDPVPIVFPNGARPLRDVQGVDQFVVSPDGQWIAAVAGDTSARAVYVFSVNDPEDVIRASPIAGVYAELPRFSLNSQALYFLSGDAAGGANQSLYTVGLDDPDTPAQISAAPAPGSSDTVFDYSVASDQSRILLQAVRGGRVGLYFVDPTNLRVEVQVNHVLASGEAIVASTVGLELGSGGSARGERVAYTTQRLLTFRTYVAEASTSPNPREIGPVGAIVIGFRPDGAALLYARNGEINEAVIDSAAADQAIGEGGLGWYDSTGNIVLLEQSLQSGGSPSRYPALAVAVRGSFGTAQPLGTSGMAAHYINTSGIDRGVVVIGEGATTGSAPATARLALVNALAPEHLFYLADFESPLQLTSDTARVVTP